MRWTSTQKIVATAKPTTQPKPKNAPSSFTKTPRRAGAASCSTSPASPCKLPTLRPSVPSLLGSPDTWPEASASRSHSERRCTLQPWGCPKRRQRSKTVGWRDVSLWPVLRWNPRRGDAQNHMAIDGLRDTVTQRFAINIAERDFVAVAQFHLPPMISVLRADPADVP
jgi:hypothetical protein